MMDKRILKLMIERRSAMAFSPEPIPVEDINAIVEAATLAPSSYNDQPWFFVVANRNGKGFDTILHTLAPANQEWARNAGALVATATRNISRQSGNPNYYAIHDLGLATTNLLIQAQSLGYVTHVMGGFDHALLKQKLNFPDEFAMGTVIALGKPGKNEMLSEQQLQRQVAQRIRKPLQEVFKLI